MLRKFASPAWAILEYGWYPLLLFAFTPWFLHRLGTELYGHWMLLTATIALGGLLNAGTGAATIKAISAKIGRCDDLEAARTINASLAIAIVGGGILAAIVLVVFWIGAASLLARMGAVELVRLTGIAAAVMIWLEQLDNVFSSAMKGAERFAEAARIEIVSKTVQVLGVAAVLVISSALWAIYAVLLLIGVLRLLLKIFMVRRLFAVSTLRPSMSNVDNIFHFAKWGWLQGIGAVLFGVADRILIGSLLGAASLTYYSIASQLAMQIHAISAAGLSVIFPKVSRMIESGSELSVSSLVKRTVAGNMLLSSTLAVLLALAGPAILRIWIGSDAAEPTGQLLPWLIAAYWILALNVVFHYLLLGMGRIRFVAITALTSGMFAVVAIYVGISTAGQAGTPAGRLAYAVCSLVLAVPLLRDYLRERKMTAVKLQDVAAGIDGP